MAGTNSGVGKTTLTIGLILALKKRGLNVQPFKAGPDYIDPSYHTLISDRSCRNLDTWMLSEDAVLELFERQAKLSDISIVEGVMGLYDGILGREEGSSAHLAKILKSPVILVVDARSMSRSAAAVVLGYKEFDRDVDLRGVILNNIGSLSHYRSVKYAIEKNVGLPVLGFLPKDKDLILSERHLGLIPTDEKTPLGSFSRKLSNLVEKNIDVDKIIGISRQAPKLIPLSNLYGLSFPRKRESRRLDSPVKPGNDRMPRLTDTLQVTIAIARDKAFNFYYQDNLDILKRSGARLVEFSPLKDKSLPPGIDGMYIGGGYPEFFAAQLSANIRMRKAVLEYARQGLPIYAECGGLMYLVKNIIDFQGRAFPMAGVFDCSAVMANKRQALGYIEIEVRKDNILSWHGYKIRAHTFHWSYLDKTPKDAAFAYKVIKNKDKVYSDGLIYKNVLAGYAHLHFASNIHLARNFIKSCVDYKEKQW